MGLIGRILGAPAAATAIGEVASSVAEVFTPNATKRMEAGQAARVRVCVRLESLTKNGCYLG